MGFHEQSTLVVALDVHAGSIAARLQPAGGGWERGEGTRERLSKRGGLRGVGGRREEVEEAGVEGRHDLVIVGQRHHMRRHRGRWHNDLLPFEGELHPHLLGTGTTCNAVYLVDRK